MNNNTISPVMSHSSTKPGMRPRSKSRFSFRSDKSSGSSHKRKESLVETAAEKRKNHMSTTTKANPNAAISEAQPIALALEKPTISSLQNFKCNDLYGNPINDPDASNPTRWRMERPLDTIRSFELAIDRAHAHRQSTYILTDQTPFVPPSRRTSSHMGISHQQNGGYDHGARHPNGGYSASRSRESFGDFAVGNGQHSNSFHGSAVNGNSPGGYTPRQDMRASSGSDQWNISTGPTSEEGSVERVNGVARPVPSHHPSGLDIHTGLPDDERTRGAQPYAGQQNVMRRMPPPGTRAVYGNGRPTPQSGPRPSMRDGPAPPSQKIQLGAGQGSNGAVQAPPPIEKRSSWLKRTFSRNK